MPATGNLVAVSLLGGLRAGVVVTAPRVGTTGSVLGAMVGVVIRKDCEAKFAPVAERNHNESGVSKVIQSR